MKSFKGKSRFMWYYISLVTDTYLSCESNVYDKFWTWHFS